jgi:hypothetical protein
VHGYFEDGFEVDYLDTKGRFEFELLMDFLELVGGQLTVFRSALAFLYAFLDVDEEVVVGGGEGRHSPVYDRAQKHLVPFVLVAFYSVGHLLF